MASQTITALGNAIINLVDRKTPIATASTVGMVKPDGSTINIDANGVISSNGGGATRNIGEIVSSTVPLVDAGLHLLDGALIDGAGIYSDFVSYMADLYGDGTDVPSYFCTESAWQTAVTTYGSCGKFVYDSVNNTVRLPKVTGKIDGTTDVNALGDLAPLIVKLPNITGSFAIDKTSYYWSSTYVDGAFYNNGTTANGNSASQDGQAPKIGFSASRSSSVYSGNGTDTTIHEQAINVLLYIVIATSTKTDIQVDIDEVATDLNSKVDKSDLAEVQCVVETYKNGTSWYRIYSDGWCEQGGHYTNTSTQTVSFLKTFSNTNYCVYFGKSGNDSQPIVAQAIDRNTSGFTLTCAYNGSYTGYQRSYFWKACGYIEV